MTWLEQAFGILLAAGVCGWMAYDLLFTFKKWDEEEDEFHYKRLH